VREVTVNHIDGSTEAARFRLLYDLGCAFASRLQLDDVVDVVIVKCREVLGAEAASILLLDAERNELYFPYTAEVDPEVAARLREIRFPADRGIAGAVVKSGEPVCVADVATDTRFYSGVDRRTGAHTRNLLCAPLRSQRGTIGVIEVMNRRGGTFSDDDLAFLDALAGTIAVAIENARMYAQLKEQVVVLERAVREHNELLALRRELDIARSIQQSIVPRRFPERPDVEIFADMLPAQEVGGDFYDFFFIDVERLGVVIGDVSGKGVPAALFMAVTRTLLRSTALSGASPAECLARVNALLIPENTEQLFVTIFYGILNVRTGALDYSNGGHNPPYLLRADGTVEMLARTAGTVLGMLEDVRFNGGTAALDHGDGLFLYTDGITEAMDPAGRLFTDSRLRSALARTKDATPERLIQSIIDEVQRYTDTAAQNDDVTALAVRIGTPQKPRHSSVEASVTITLRNDLAELEGVSDEVEAFGQTHQVPARAVFDVNLCLDEVLTNIISYAYDDGAAHEIIVRLSVNEGSPATQSSRELRIEIEDDGRAFNPLAVEQPELSGPAEERPIGGLGLRLVRKLMTGLEYRRSDGKNVLLMHRVVAQ